jgi:DNA replication licensing factor MCM7
MFSNYYNCIFFRPQNITDQIFAAIKDMLPESGPRTIKIADIRERCAAKGYKPDQIDSCLEEYEELNVWQVNQAQTKLTFV